ncbi:MAG: sugar-binding domain-containing protein [bacterium]
MKHAPSLLISLLLRGLFLAGAVNVTLADNVPDQPKVWPRSTAPANPQELDARLGELRQQYAPYLRSLPVPLPKPARTILQVEWKFTYEAKAMPKAEGIPPAPDWHGVGFDDSKWESTTVPEWRYRTAESDDSAVDPDKVDQWQGHGRNAETICWYRTPFRAEPTPAGKRTWLCFDGVEWEAQVYLNGELLGMHGIYYEPFRFDVTGKLKKENTLAVRVISGNMYGEPMSHWGIFPDVRAAKQRYTPDRAQSIPGNLPIGYHMGGGFGIFGKVYLEQTGRVHISAIFARNDLSDGKARIKVELDGKPATDLKVEIMPENFAGRSYTKTGKENVVDIPMPEAKVWSPESPYLYRCRVTAGDSDARDVLFGCRSFGLLHRKGEPEKTPLTMPIYTFKPVKANWLRIVARGSNFSSVNSIREVDCPAIVPDKTRITTDKPTKQHPPAQALDGKKEPIWVSLPPDSGDNPQLALDGKMESCWVAVGRGRWIQFPLDGKGEFDHIAIGWLDVQNRKWNFDLLVSDDGVKWTKLAYAQPSPKPEAPAKDGLASGTFLLNGKPCYLRGTNTHGLNCYSYWGQTEELLNALLLLKAANFNCTRVNQHVDFPDVRELMDRLGIMSQQEQGAGISRSGLRSEQFPHTGAVLASQTYNNPGVVLLCFGNECDYQVEPVLRAALAVDPQRIFKPISGRSSSSRVPWNLPEDLRANAVDDSHSYSGWYGNNVPQTWYNLGFFSPRRLVTVGEYGAEALDAYETMRDHYPPQIKPPAPETDTLWAAAQVKKHDVKQIAGLGRDPQNLGEYIEASQNYQASLMADRTIGMRLSPDAVGGYFQFHFIDVVPAHWPKSIVSHDQRPKQAYYAMAQVNQPVVALPQLTGAKPDAMKLWVANDLSESFPGAAIHWTVSHAGKVLLSGEQKRDVPAVGVAVGGEEIDLLPVTRQVPSFDLELTLKDSGGKELSRYRRTVRVVPPELLKLKAGSNLEDPFNK